jgi:prolyl-tRNA synthetase
MGPRDLANGTVEVARRDTLEKQIMPVENIDEAIETLLEEIQQNIFQKALDFRNENIRKADTWEEFSQLIAESKGGFVSAHWDGTVETEQLLKIRPKLPSAVFLWMEFLKKVNVYTVVNHRNSGVLFALAY